MGSPHELVRWRARTQKSISNRLSTLLKDQGCSVLYTQTRHELFWCEIFLNIALYVCMSCVWGRFAKRPGAKLCKPRGILACSYSYYRLQGIWALGRVIGACPSGLYCRAVSASMESLATF